MDKDDLKRLFYSNEITFSFDKYITKMKQTFNVIYTYNVTLYENDKVRQLLDYINFPNNDLKTDVTICRSIHSASFYTAFAYLSTVISLLFP